MRYAQVAHDATAQRRATVSDDNAKLAVGQAGGGRGMAEQGSGGRLDGVGSAGLGVRVVFGTVGSMDVGRVSENRCIVFLRT